MTHTPYIAISSNPATAVLYGIAVVVVLALAGLQTARADTPPSQTLAAELLIVRGDLARLYMTNNLPPAHIDGLRDRIAGALGLLPWLLRQVGDDAGALRLRASSDSALIDNLDLLIARHPLDLSPYELEHLTAQQRREAVAIHDTYCAGCHDDTGQGDPDTALPARDLFEMAKEAAPEVFLARLINGVKGDETLLFANPLTPAQIGALWHLYRR
ncbi:hypothetical protein [Magnetovibrio sp.]|uniref:hypothetical protein n=1 Tax=Magnetovibrio sp. TaxID=2024836 RepID=UPI002F93F6D4